MTGGQGGDVARIDIDAIEDEWEDDEPGRASRPRLSVTARQRLDEHSVGRVTGIDRGRVTVLVDGREVAARFGGSMRGQRVVVGDRVRIAPGGGVPRVVALLERDTVLQRSGDDVADDGRIVVANVDEVVVVVAADHLGTARGFADRVLVAAAAGGIDAAVCLNKMDLAPADGAAVAATLSRYRDAGYDVLTTSAATGEGIAALAERLPGRWTALTGHSGVGKSSLINQLVPTAGHEVGALGPRGGRHTTVRARALPVVGHDAWVVDTPGVRSFGLGAVEPAELARAFPGMADLDCRLDGCLHDGEPGCGVASPTADVTPDRLRAYRRLLATMRSG